MSQEIIDQIRNGDQMILGEVYEKYREEFVRWLIKQYGIETETALDVYQQTAVAFYDNIASGRLIELKSNLKTYLFAIGKNKVMEELKYKNKFIGKEDYEFEREDPTSEEALEKERKLNAIERSLDLLGEHCKKLLQLFYYKEQSIENITNVMQYKNKATAKNQKYKCMEKLRKLHAKKDLLNHDQY